MKTDTKIYQLQGNTYRTLDGNDSYIVKGDIWCLINDELRYLWKENKLYTQIKLFEYNYLIEEVCLEHPMMQAEATSRWLYKQEIENLTLQQDAWYKGIQTLNQSLNRKELLTTLIDNVMLAMPAVDRGFFMLFDEQQQLLVPVASAGLKSSIYMFKTMVGEGIAGKVFATRKAYAYTNAEASIAMQNLTPENEHHLMVAVNSSKKEIDNQISMAAPVAIGETCYGVLVLHQYTSDVHYNDMKLLQAFADQAAVAIHNAELYEDMQRMNADLMKQQHIHSLFTNLALENSPVGQIVKVAEELLCKSCYFIDAYEFQPTPQVKAIQQVVKSIALQHWTKRKPHLVEVKDESYYLYPVLNGRAIVGYFIVECEHLLKDMDLVIIEQASVVIALKLSNRRSLEESIHLQRKELVQQLLLQKKDARLNELALEGGFKVEEEMMVCIAQFRLNESERVFFDLQITQFLAQCTTELNDTPFFYKDRNSIVFIVQGNIKKFSETVRFVTERWNGQTHHTVMAGASSIQKNVSLIAQAYQEAVSTVDYLKKGSKQAFLQYDELGINQLFLTHDAEKVNQFTLQILAPLQEPRAVASQLEETLLHYVRLNRSVSKTAHALHIHQNTLYHRLAKIEELLQMKLNDWNDFLTITLALHLKQ